jgi:hypothetical protein
MLGKGHKYGSMEQFMEMMEYGRKGNIKNPKENNYIYQFKQLNGLIEEQKNMKEKDSQNNMVDTDKT